MRRLGVLSATRTVSYVLSQTITAIYRLPFTGAMDTAAILAASRPFVIAWIAAARLPAAAWSCAVGLVLLAVVP